jgi:hypothetical protein
MAWWLIALARDPLSLTLVRSVTAPGAGAAMTPGVVLDDWSALSSEEQARRHAWLDRHGATPLRRLGVPEEVIELAGLRVTEWELPPGVDAASVVAQSRPNSPLDGG